MHNLRSRRRPSITLRFQESRHEDRQVQNIAIAEKIGFRKNQGTVDPIALCRKRVVKRRMRFVATSRLDLDGKHVPAERFLYEIELPDFFST